MKIFVNGDERESTSANIRDLADELGLPAPTLLIEHNGEALRREEWEGRTIADGDRVEILRIAAGG